MEDKKADSLRISRKIDIIPKVKHKRIFKNQRVKKKILCKLKSHLESLKSQSEQDFTLIDSLDEDIYQIERLDSNLTIRKIYKKWEEQEGWEGEI